VSWRYLLDILDNLTGVLEIFHGCPGDVSWVSFKYLIGFQDVFHSFPGNISYVSLDIF